MIDIREAGFETEFLEVLSKIRKDVSPWLIFLEASDETLLKRYSESRRPHPLKSKKSVLESIQLERERLAEIKRLADEVEDTSDMNIAQLREILNRRFLKKKTEKLIQELFPYEDFDGKEHDEILTAIQEKTSKKDDSKKV